MYVVHNVALDDRFITEDTSLALGKMLVLMTLLCLGTRFAHIPVWSTRRAPAMSHCRNVQKIHSVPWSIMVLVLASNSDSIVVQVAATPRPSSGRRRSQTKLWSGEANKKAHIRPRPMVVQFCSSAKANAKPLQFGRAQPGILEGVAVLR